MSLSADAATVARGGSLALTAVVAGPAGVVAPCDAPVTVIVSDAGGAHVFSASPAAAPGEPCGTLTLAAGQQAAFHAVWEVDPTLPTGRYEVAVTVGDQPEVDVAATVSGGVAGAPAC